MSDMVSIHAEHDAITKLRNFMSVKINKNRKINKKLRVDLIVISRTKTGKLASSKPCIHCVQRLIKATIKLNVYIKNVHYSTPDGTIEITKFRDLVKDDSLIPSSSSRRNY
jgi:hypothetical protein